MAPDDDLPDLDADLDADPARDPAGPAAPAVGPVVMDSAMDTGSDAGEPGDRPDEGPLTPDERALLDRLAHDDGPAVVTDAPEDSPAAARAVADDTVLPDAAASARAGPDQDTPEFRAP